MKNTYNMHIYFKNILIYQTIETKPDKNRIRLKKE